MLLKCREKAGGGQEPGERERVQKIQGPIPDTLLDEDMPFQAYWKKLPFLRNKIDIQNWENLIIMVIIKIFQCDEFTSLFQNPLGLVNFSSIKTKPQHFGLPFVLPSLLLSIKVWFNVTLEKEKRSK